MSGLEVAGVVFGVLPVIIEAIKAYTTVSDSLYTFRHYSREVKSIQVRLKVHCGIFRNECHLLLCMIEEERGVKGMLENENDSRWTSKEFNDRLNEVLNDSLELCQNIIEASKETVDVMKDEMKKFDVFAEKKWKDESVKAAIRRLRNTVQFTFNKSKYESSLASLRDRNNELASLRSHIGELKQHKSGLETSCVGHKILPSRFRSIHSASQKLHEALASSWCCGDVNHSGHHAKLCLDADVQAEVRLDLAIACQEVSQQGTYGYLLEPPIWLYVQSASIDRLAYPESSNESATVPHLAFSENELPSSPAGLKKKASSDLASSASRKNKRRKKVRFSNLSQDTGFISFHEPVRVNPSCVVEKTTVRKTTLELDLCQTKNICYYLKHQLYCKPLTKHCVGYLESPQMYRHIFYLQEKNTIPNLKPKSPAKTLSFSIFDAMQEESDDDLSMVDQLKLAHKAALATLQFNDTPWLSPHWRLKDISSFGSRITFNEEVLKTLHLSSEIAAPSKGVPTSIEQVTGEIYTASEEDYFGINNTTLFFLGVAMLEIAHWKPLESQMVPRDANEILTARRLASRPTPLGPRYQEITRKCLQCNFGFGTDLRKKELQAAVYGDVVCQLERMIDSLSI